MKLNIELNNKYIVTGTRHDMVLSEKKIVEKGDNAGKEKIVFLGYYSKFENLVRELCHREILDSESQSLQELEAHIKKVGIDLAKSLSDYIDNKTK